MEKIMDSILSGAPRVLKGAKGTYWRYAASGEGDKELFLKFQVESHTLAGSNGPLQGEVLQVNVMYVGEPFEVPEPYKLLDMRSYPDPLNGKELTGAILGKMYVPLGSFNQAIKAVLEYARDHAGYAITEALQPLLDATGIFRTMTVEKMLDLSIQEMFAGREMLEPKALVNMQWVEYGKTEVKQSAKNAAPPDLDDEESDDDENEDTPL